MTSTLTPVDRTELVAALQTAARDRSPLPRLDLRQLNRISRYAPEDLTITVESGLSLGALQQALGEHGQWLPIDPPAADSLSIAAILDADLSGPRRCGHGTIREHLIGLHVALADGRIIRSGGNVVKNVAGYDLMKLFVGARRSLGIIVEAAFKLMPRPAREVFVGLRCATWRDASQAVEAVLASPVTPVVLDLHRVESTDASIATLALGFAGSVEEVEWQLGEARSLGFREPVTLDYAGRFAAAGSEPVRESVLPSRLVERLQALGGADFVARAGNGVAYHRTTLPADRPMDMSGPASLMRRLKDTFDPGHILPDLPEVPRA